MKLAAKALPTRGNNQRINCNGTENVSALVLLFSLACSTRCRLVLANPTLSRSLVTTYPAALIIVAVSATSLLAAGLISGQLGWPGGERLNGAPWWAWTGGVMGAIVVMCQ